MAAKEIVLRRLRDAQDHAGVLHREEALGHDDVETAASATSVPTVTSRVMRLVLQHPLQRAAVERDHPVEEASPMAR